MIPARKSGLISAWLARDAESRMQQTFGRVFLRGAEAAKGALALAPLIVVSNHTAFWDPLVAQMISVRVLHADAYAMMDAANLRRLPFFAKVGAFGVDPRDPKDGARAIRYAAKLLTAPGRLVWIFPQGEEVPVAKEPLVFRGGSAEIARVAKRARTLPVGIRYVFAKERLPRLYVSLGAPIAREDSIGAQKAAEESAVTRELDAIDHALLFPEESHGFELVSKRDDGIFFRLAQSMLSALTRPRELR